jgi:hypothetical protein
MIRDTIFVLVYPSYLIAWRKLACGSIKKFVPRSSTFSYRTHFNGFEKDNHGGDIINFTSENNLGEER